MASWYVSEEASAVAAAMANSGSEGEVVTMSGPTTPVKMRKWLDTPSPISRPTRTAKAAKTCFSFFKLKVLVKKKLLACCLQHLESREAKPVLQSGVH